MVDAPILKSLCESESLPEEAEDDCKDDAADVDNIDSTFAEWRDAFVQSCKVMKQREEAMESTPLGHNDNASLVLACGDVDASHKKSLNVTSNMVRHIAYVRWKDPLEHLGQPIRPDNMNRLVWSVTSMIP